MNKMYYWSILMLMLIAMPLLVACSGDDEPEQSRSTSAYYVKYEASYYFGSQIINTFNVNYMTDKGMMKYENEAYGRRQEWEGTYGPFKKGDNVSLTVKCTAGEVTGRIYVSRDKEPFVIKNEGTSQRKLTLDYTIDF